MEVCGTPRYLEGAEQVFENSHFGFNVENGMEIRENGSIENQFDYVNSPGKTHRRPARR